MLTEHRDPARHRSVELTSNAACLCRILPLLVYLLISGCDAPVRGQSDVASSFGTLGPGAGQFVQPRAIAASPNGKLFVIDRTGRVQRFDSFGHMELAWEMPDNRSDVGKPSGICVDSRGRVFVADTHHHRVIVFEQDGAELFRFGEEGNEPGQFMLLTDVAVDRAGFIYVCEYGVFDRISKFDPQGKYLLSFGGISAGAGALQRPSGLAVDDRGNVWVADTSNHRVCCFDFEGKFLGTFGGLGTSPGKLRYPRDVALLANGDVAVVEQGNNRISVFSADGRFICCWGEPGRKDGQLHDPLNLAALGGVVAVADTQNDRIVLAAVTSIVKAFGGAVASRQ